MGYKVTRHRTDSGTDAAEAILDTLDEQGYELKAVVPLGDEFWTLHTTKTSQENRSSFAKLES